MNRPLLMRLLPDRLRSSVCYRVYRPVSERWLPLYKAAKLRYAPQVHMDLVPGDVLSDCIALTGFWDLNLTRHLVGLARQGGTMIELGANLGYFSLLWAAASKENRCFSYEASPRNVEVLERNLALNECGARVRVFPHAVGKTAGSMNFDLGPADQRGWGGLTTESGKDIVRVDVVRVDETADEIDEVALLKSDLEGADTWALMGCERLLRERRIKEIWFEQNKPRMKTLGVGETEAADYLMSVGYKCSPRTDPRAELVEWSAVPG